MAGAHEESDTAAKGLSGVLKDLSNSFLGMGKHGDDGALVPRTLRAAAIDAGAGVCNFRAEIGIVGEALKDMGLLGIAASLGIGVVAAASIKAVKSFSEFQYRGVRLRAELAAVGQQGKTSFSELEKAEQSLSAKALYGPNQGIQAGTKLAKYPSISREDIKKFLPLAVKIATQMGTTLPQAARQLGQYLQDPIVGIQRLAYAIHDAAAVDRQIVRNTRTQGATVRYGAIVARELHKYYNERAKAATARISGAYAVCRYPSRNGSAFGHPMLSIN